MIEEAVVDRVMQDKAILKLTKPGTCTACRACFGWRNRECFIEVENTINAKTGNIVKVEIDERVILKMFLIVYAIPFLGFIGGIFLGYVLFKIVFDISNYEIFCFLSGIVATLTIYLLNRKWAQSILKKYKAKILNSS